jgi:hypothetical protein
MTAVGSTLQNKAIFSFMPFCMGCSVRHTKMSGCTPRLNSSFTLCWVGLVFSSPLVLR